MKARRNLAGKKEKGGTQPRPAQGLKLKRTDFEYSSSRSERPRGRKKVKVEARAEVVHRKKKRTEFEQKLIKVRTAQGPKEDES